MENTISDRICLLINELGYNKRTFSQAIGLSNDVTIGRIVNEHREPSYKILNNIIQTFGNISADWLITGRGEMLLEKSISKSISDDISLSSKDAYLNGQADGQIVEKNARVDAQANAQVFEKNVRVDVQADVQVFEKNSNPNGHVAVPFYDIPVSAGPLGVLTYSRVVEPDGCIDMEIFRHCEAILPVVGVSMEPEIRSGDLIGIRKLDCYSWDYVETGKVYMIVTHEDRMIKYINKADDVDYIVCSSPNYSDFKVRKSDVLEVYRVIANIHAF